MSSTAPKSSTTTTAAAAAAASISGWSDVAVQAAKDFTVSQRKKLSESGALDVPRPLKIIGERPAIAESGDVPRDDDAAAAPDNCKIIHFQRHGQGYHNLICDIWREWDQPIDFDSADPALNPVVRQELLDPPLTYSGVQQCRARRAQCSRLNPQLVIVSPLLRCIQTAKLSFRDHWKTGVPWVAHEGCREELGLLAGNKRRPLDEIREDHPEIDFSAIQHEEDALWDAHGEARETLLEESDRIYDFLTSYVAGRPEREIAIVSHSAYLFALLNAVADVEEEDLKSWFLTSEVRTIQMRFVRNEHYVDESAAS